MTDYPGGRRNPPDDPTDEPVSDPVPTGDDVVNRHRRGHDTPRQYEDADVDRQPGSGVRPSTGSGRPELVEGWDAGSGETQEAGSARPVVRDLGSE